MKTTGVKTVMVRLFGRKPTPRVWEFDPRDVPKILRLLDNNKRHPGQESLYRFWTAVYELYPDLRGLDVSVKIHLGGAPYVEENL